MTTFDDVARLASELPAVTEGEDKHGHGHRTWQVGGKTFAWERPFSKADIRRYGTQAPPQGPILAACTADLHDKEAALAANPDAFFTIPHFDGYKAVLILLDKGHRGSAEGGAHRRLAGLRAAGPGQRIPGRPCEAALLTGAGACSRPQLIRVPAGGVRCRWRR